MKVENWDQEEGMYITGQMGKTAMTQAWSLSGSSLKGVVLFLTTV